MSRDKPSDIANKNNANHSILFEAINLVVSLGNDAPDDLYDKVCPVPSPACVLCL